MHVYRFVSNRREDYEAGFNTMVSDMTGEYVWGGVRDIGCYRVIGYKGYGADTSILVSRKIGDNFRQIDVRGLGIDCVKKQLDKFGIKFKKGDIWEK